MPSCPDDERAVHPRVFFSPIASPLQSETMILAIENCWPLFALEEWRHWLEGSKVPFLVRTDHKNLEYIHTAKRLSSRQAHWSLFFSRFNFTLSFHAGFKNAEPYALSHIFPLSSNPVKPGNVLPSLCSLVLQWGHSSQLFC